MVLAIASGCVAGEYKVAGFDRVVAREAGFERCSRVRFAVFELSKPPTTRRGVFSGVLDHKLNVRGGPGHERLGASKDFVVFLRRNVTPCQPGNDGAVRERQLPLAVCLDRYIVAEKARRSLTLPSSWATEISFQSRYPGGIVIPKTGSASP